MERWDRLHPFLYFFIIYIGTLLLFALSICVFVLDKLYKVGCNPYHPYHLFNLKH